jgi:hypothetical protein
MKGGVCYATRLVEERFFFDIDVKGGEMSKGVEFGVEFEIFL